MGKLKKCNKCNTEKSIDEFYARENKCKLCKKNNRKPVEPDARWSLYYLRDSNYIGITSRLKQRMQNHRTKSGRKTEGYKVLLRSKNVRFIVFAEAFFHLLGFNGFKQP